VLEELVSGHTGHPVVGDDHVDIGDEAQARQLTAQSEKDKNVSNSYPGTNHRPIQPQIVSWGRKSRGRQIKEFTSVLGVAEDLGDDGPVVDGQDGAKGGSTA
jgi:hypothetical protein